MAEKNPKKRVRRWGGISRETRHSNTEKKSEKVVAERNAEIRFTALSARKSSQGHEKKTTKQTPTHPRQGEGGETWTQIRVGIEGTRDGGRNASDD